MNVHPKCFSLGTGQSFSWHQAVLVINVEFMHYWIPGSPLREEAAAIYQRYFNMSRPRYISVSSNHGHGHP